MLSALKQEGTKVAVMTAERTERKKKPTCCSGELVSSQVKHLFDPRTQGYVTEKLEDPTQIRKTRRDGIARVKTILHQREAAKTGIEA